MDFNWQLLLIAILAPCSVSVEGAAALWKSGAVSNHELINYDGEIIEMVKEGMTHKQIGEVLGMTRSAVNQRMVRLRRKNKEGRQPNDR